MFVKSDYNLCVHVLYCCMAELSEIGRELSTFITDTAELEPFLSVESKLVHKLVSFMKL